MAAEIMDWSDEQYFADRTAVSNSMLKCFAESPALYYGRYIENVWPQAPNADMKFGSFVHDHIVRLDGLRSVIRAPRDVLSKTGRKAGKKWKEYVAANGHLTVWSPSKTPDDTEKLGWIVEALLRHPRAANILLHNAAVFETVIRWDHGDDMLKRKAKIDIIIPLEESVVIADLKTTSRQMTLKSLSQEIYNRQYHWQAATYIEAYQEILREPLPISFIFIFVSKVPPYSVRCVQCSQRFIDLGIEANAKHLEDLAQRQASGDWSDRDDLVYEVEPPGYSDYETQWEVAQ